MMQEGVMQQMLWLTSHISWENTTYVEALYEQFLHKPSAVSKKWRDYFEYLLQGNQNQYDMSKSIIIANQYQTRHTIEAEANMSHQYKQIQVIHLINAFRMHGHQQANIDPLGCMQRKQLPDLNLNNHGLSEIDLDTEFQTSTIFIGKEHATLREIIEALTIIYSGSIGIEYMHIVNAEERCWFQDRIEMEGKSTINTVAKKHILEQLTAAEGFEKYLGTKYPGSKRFSLEGSESLILMLDELIQRAGSYGTKELVIGMAHRGRLNVLVNIFGKKPTELFDEFEGKKITNNSAGDVKYHQGFSSNVMTPGGEVHLALAFNPSHLEIVSPVIAGSVRARQDRRQDDMYKQVIPLSIHGDAAFSGQGVVMETLQMSQARAYKTGGTIHIIINNQIGFTTSNREDARSTEYCTDVAKIVNAPIQHVNSDDPEAVRFVTQLALDYRMKFKRDVVIDLVCYRRHGHNEADEPSTTQPMMYHVIKNKKTTRELYASMLIESGLLEAEEDKKLVDNYRKTLDKGEYVVKTLVKEPNKKLFVNWTPYLGHEWTTCYDTRLAYTTLTNIGQKLSKVPEGFVVQRQVRKLLDDRMKMASGILPINWGAAEILAYGTLLMEGYPVRITGQDVGRGTFSHRHAVLHNQKDGSCYVPLANIANNQASIQIWDSLLSEEAVLAFEYGYSTTMPNALVVWEAQFGDFANGCQIVIDQFITSGEHKWGRLCGLTMLLPHGYEGQGPEHSSARLERYLQLCANHNIQVCVPSTPAQIFHMLRRQVLRLLRKPLIAFTPKSLLRHKRAVSKLEDLTTGTFQTLIPEITEHNPKKITRLIICSGKVYYDLLEYKLTSKKIDTAIIRIEQLYPFPQEHLENQIAQYSNLQNVVWCQEEPMNQGAWSSIQHYICYSLAALYSNKALSLVYAGRNASAAPACGYISKHMEEQQNLIKDAFNV